MEFNQLVQCSDGVRGRYQGGTQDGRFVIASGYSAKYYSPEQVRPLTQAEIAEIRRIHADWRKRHNQTYGNR